MPYIQRSVPQALDLVDPGVIDVYSSPSVFINNVQTALWQAPVLGNSVLSQLAIPTPPPLQDYAPNPEQINNYKASASAANANPIEIEYSDGAKANQAQGNCPGPKTDDPNDLAGNPEPTTPSVSLPAGSGVFGALESYLNQCIQEALPQKSPGGKWYRTFSAPGNPNIMNCFAHTGGIAAANRLGVGDTVPWCAAFAGTVLQAIGVKAMISFSVDSYYDAKTRTSQWVAKTGATPISISDPTLWRRYDVCVISGAAGHHIAFIRGVDTKTGRVRLAGGNQGNNMTEVNFGSSALGSVGFIGRAWEIPPEFDKPIVGTLSSGGLVHTR